MGGASESLDLTGNGPESEFKSEFANQLIVLFFFLR